jgi:hypothetical protein
MAKNSTLYQAYAFPGFKPDSKLLPMDEEPDARVIVLRRTQKKRYARSAGKGIGLITTARPSWLGINPAATCLFTY